MKKLPLGIQNIKEIIEGNYVYIDKTQYIYDLINSAKYYFLSRPRRFGKSLLLDTIGEVFLGNKELFKGLWIYDSDYDFAEYPIVRLDMIGIANDTPEILNKAIMSYLKHYYEKEGFNFNESSSAEVFRNLIFYLNQKYNKKVVVLIDEYDHPILNRLSNKELATANQGVIRDVYGVLKSMDAYLKFVFLTGVSKFARTAVFSGLNQLRDITMAEDYAGICGVPVKDLDKYFGEHIDNLIKLNRFKDNDIREKILKWYDGYSWDAKTKMLNPWALLYFFFEKQFENFWYITGSPKFLIDLILKSPERYLYLKNLVLDKKDLDAFNIEMMPIESILFQTGYLTIVDIIENKGAGRNYVLDMPNFEVKDALNQHVMTALVHSDDVLTGNTKRQIRKALQEGDLNSVLDLLRSLFASIPYELHIRAEAYYHTVFYVVMTVLGFNIKTEVSTARGRIDAVLETNDHIYIFEFKYVNTDKNITPEESGEKIKEATTAGLTQIKERGYHEPYINSGKQIHLAAFAFLGRDNIGMETEVLL